jgi:hypothetical protein
MADIESGSNIVDLQLQPHFRFRVSRSADKDGLSDLSSLSTVPRCLKRFKTPYIVDSGCPVSRAIADPFSPRFSLFSTILQLQNVAKSEDNFNDVIALPDPLSMFGCEILCYYIRVISLFI